MMPASRPVVASGTTASLIDLVADLSWDKLPAEVLVAGRRHLLDTVGVMIAGGASELVGRLEATLGALREAGDAPVPGRRRRADALDAAFLGGTAAHGLELDDGYRQGSVHPGVAVVPALLAACHGRAVSGRELLLALVAGYETITHVAGACHPHIRKRGFHPTGVTGPLGAAMAVGRLLGLDRCKLSNALGLAASGSAGLFAFLNGGADVKRLHAGHAAREGLFAALCAANGVEGPPGVLETTDGFFRAFAGAAASLNAEGHFGITDCYIKPYPCCRHLQPAAEALMTLRLKHSLIAEEVESIEVATYGIAAAHASTGWDQFASAQLSFPFIMALSLQFGSISLDNFDAAHRSDPKLAAICKKVSVQIDPELDRRYPASRPARVTVKTARGVFVEHAEEARGSRQLPLDDDGLFAKFEGLVDPVLGSARAGELLRALQGIEQLERASDVAEAAALSI